MEPGIVTIEDVLNGVDRDPDLDTQRAKCDVYRRLVEWGRELGREECPRLGSQGGAEFPLPEERID